MNEDLAKQRFMILSLVRLLGAALAVFGLLIIAGKIAVPVGAGYVFFVFGLVETMFLPPFLARRWKSPPP